MTNELRNYIPEIGVLEPAIYDLTRYRQTGLAKPRTLFPRNVKAGKRPIRFVGERFHNLPALNLSVAWLTWEAP